MKWFRRKPKTFDYAAIRIGNVYVLPPDEDDVREFRQKRRKEITRRGFIVAGIGVGLAAIALPFIPGKRSNLTPEMLFSIDPATANPTILKQLCLMFYQHPDEEVRYQCARVMGTLSKEPEAKKALWLMIENDAVTRVRDKAIESIIRHRSKADVPQIVNYYHQTPSARPMIDLTIRRLRYVPLRVAIESWVLR